MYAPMYIYCYHIMVCNLHKVITIKRIKHVAIPLIGISLAKNNLMMYVRNFVGPTWQGNSDVHSHG